MHGLQLAASSFADQELRLGFVFRTIIACSSSGLRWVDSIVAEHHSTVDAVVIEEVASFIIVTTVNQHTGATSQVGIVPWVELITNIRRMPYLVAVDCCSTF